MEKVEVGQYWLYDSDTDRTVSQIVEINGDIAIELIIESNKPEFWKVNEKNHIQIDVMGSDAWTLLRSYNTPLYKVLNK